MPTYDMKCTACETRFERFLTRILADADKVCPSCGSRDVEVVPSAPFVPRTGGGCSPRGGFG